MQYKILEFKGQGGFGKVEVVQVGTEVKACKTFELSGVMKGNPSLEENAKKRFIKEAKYQHSINHKNIVPVTKMFLTEEPPYFIMPLAEKSLLEDLSIDHINTTNFLEPIFDIMSGLEEIHSIGIHHRDLKPSNVLRFRDSSTGQYFYAIGDFGLMSLAETGVTTLTTAGMHKSSDMYTAPEITQDLRYASAQSDIYSLACIIHDIVGTKKRIPCHEIDEPGDYCDLLKVATRLDPTRRFKSISSFREALIEISKVATIAKTQPASDLIDILENEKVSLSEADFVKLADFLSSSISQNEKNIVLSRLSLNRIEEIIANCKQASYIAKNYFDYVRNNGFDFSFCDTLAGRIECFMKIIEIDVLVEAAFALLYLGTSHNRWYVEFKAVKYFKGDIEERLLKRILMEIRVEGSRFCTAINHLFYSINYSLEVLHPEIQRTIKEICK